MFPQKFEILNSLVYSKEIQRLKYIKQLGILYLLYPNASHTRFQHSMGVAKLVINNENLASSKEELEHIAIAGLLHDIGHGPFSHLFKKNNFDHETKTLELIDKNFLNEKFDKQFVKNIIQGINCQIIKNNNGIDLDRIDYLIRDTRMLNRKSFIDESIIKRIKIINNKIIFDFNDKSKVEEINNTRNFMFKNFYYSPETKHLEYSFLEYLEKNGIIMNENDTDIKFNLTNFFNEYNEQKLKKFNKLITLKQTKKEFLYYTNEENKNENEQEKEIKKEIVNDEDIEIFF